MDHSDDTTIAEPAVFERSELISLLEASRTVNSELRVPLVLNRVADEARKVLSAEGASVLLINAKGDKLVFHSALGEGAEQLVGSVIDLNCGIAGKAVQTRRALLIEDVKQNRSFYDGIDQMTGQRTRSIMAVPLIHQGAVIGVVEVLNPKDGTNFTKRDLELLELFGNIVTIAAVNAQEFDRVEKSARGWRESQSRHEMMGSSRRMRLVVEQCQQFAASDFTVLITGESGTGKELAARAVHEYSPRHDKPFIARNCGAIPKDISASEFFGHEPGGFTGATKLKLGCFELADGGTLFLDEIGELPLSLQPEILRVIEEGEFTRVGGETTLYSDVRIVAATNRNLLDEVEAGRFREDLYYRINVIQIEVPPLRERKGDVVEIAEYFLQDFDRSLSHSSSLSFSPDAKELFQSYSWPGNIRELRNVVQRCAVLAANDGQVINAAHLPREILQSDSETASGTPHSSGGGASQSFAEQEKAIIAKALEESGGNVTRAARQLNISRDQMRSRIEKYGLKRQG